MKLILKYRIVFLFIGILCLKTPIFGQSNSSLNNGGGQTPTMVYSIGEVLVSQANQAQNGFIQIIAQGTTSHTDAINKQIKIKAFPNPTSSYLQFETEGIKAPFHILCFNQAGQIALSATIENNQLDVSSLAVGMYWILLNDNQLHHTHAIKFIKK